MKRTIKESTLRSLIREELKKQITENSFPYDTFMVQKVEVAILKKPNEYGRNHVSFGFGNNYAGYSIDLGDNWMDKQQTKKIFNDAFKAFYDTLEKGFGGKIRDFK